MFSLIPIVDALKNIDVKGSNGGIKIAVPGWLVLFLVVGGLGVDTFGLYLCNEQIKQIHTQLDAMQVRELAHENLPTHNDAAGLMLELTQELNRIKLDRIDRNIRNDINDQTDRRVRNEKNSGK